MTGRQSLQQALRMQRDPIKRAAVQAEIDGPGPIPDETAYLMGWFRELRGARGGNGMGGLDPIEWTDITAWKRETGRRTTPWEVKLIMEIDLIFRRVMAEVG